MVGDRRRARGELVRRRAARATVRGRLLPRRSAGAAMDPERRLPRRDRRRRLPALREVRRVVRRGDGDPLVFEAGLGIRRIVAPRFDRAAAARTTVPEAAPTGSAVIATSSFRVTGVKGGAYLGLEVDWGSDASRIPVRWDAAGGRRGRRRGSLGRLELGAEAALEERILRTMDLEHASLPPMTGAVIELRARADVWLSPWLTLGGEIGAGSSNGRSGSGPSCSAFTRARSEGDRVDDLPRAPDLRP